MKQKPKPPEHLNLEVFNLGYHFGIKMVHGYFGTRRHIHLSISFMAGIAQGVRTAFGGKVSISARFLNIDPRTFQKMASGDRPAPKIVAKLPFQ